MPEAGLIVTSTGKSTRDKGLMKCLHLRSVRLIAYDIANLTDARYFAARGAHMIGFSIDLSSVEEINAIKDWVDVPEFFLHLGAKPSAELVWEWQERTGIDTFLVSGLSEDLPGLFPKAKWISFFDPKQAEVNFDLSLLFVQNNGLTLISKSSPELESYEDIPIYFELDPTNLPALENRNQFTGVLLRGSEEDKLGIKSYDEIDDFLDSVEIEY